MPKPPLCVTQRNRCRLHYSHAVVPDNVEPTITDRDFTIATIAAPSGGADEDEEGEGEEGVEGEEGAEATEGEGGDEAGGDGEDS